MKFSKNKFWFLFNSVVIYTVLIFIAFLFSLIFVEQNANSLLIRRFSAVKDGDSNIVEIVIDDDSIQKYSWPWSLDMYSDMFDYFYTYARPKVIGFDITLDDPIDENNNKDKRFLNQIRKMNNLVFQIVPESSSNNADAYFIKDFQKQHALQTTLNVSDMPTPFNGIINYPDVLRDSINAYGSVYIPQDLLSGSVLGIVNLLKIDESYFPSLALKMYLVENNTNEIVIDKDYITVPKTGLKIPYYNFDPGIVSTLIRFYPLNDSTVIFSHNNIHASRIIDTYKALKAGITPKNHPEKYDLQTGLIDPEFFRDMTVFIGGNISGNSADVMNTPMALRHPGVDIWATVYDNLKNNYFINNSSILVAFLSFFTLCLLAFICIMKYRFIRGLISIIAIDIIFLLIVICFARHGYLMSYATPIVGQFVTSVFAYSFKFLTENRNKEKIKQAMGKYISQDVMQNVVKNIDDLKLGGKRSVVTILFSDIRGFTSLSEKMEAVDVSKLLNDYFSEMEPIITKYNGVINKFIGDAVMAVFGDPIEDENHPQNAVKCAYEMLLKLEYLREKWVQEGKPKIEIGIGINTGEVFVGNIGTESRMEYTVIGDSVNLASRIESFNKEYKTNLLVSSSTYSYISSIAEVREIRDVQIRGKTQKTNIYEVLKIEI
ncbi:adenylate/guanylate cyclase domain-containing protein [bacterium]|nr:adenylate/guanylate cyclase domain-containing protein [bacterium]